MPSYRQSRAPHSSNLADIELEIQKGPGTGRTFDVKEGVLTIGRSDDCDLCIDSDSASRRHATIRRKGDDVTITDEKSHNGTYVNDKRISRTVKLSAGDRIHIGGATLCVIVNGMKSKERPDSRSDDSWNDDGEGRGLSSTQKMVVFFLTLALGTALFVLVLPKLSVVSQMQVQPAASPAPSPAYSAASPAAPIAPAPQNPSPYLPGGAVPAVAQNAAQFSAVPMGEPRGPVPIPTDSDPLPLTRRDAAAPAQERPAPIASASVSPSQTRRKSSAGRHAARRASSDDDDDFDEDDDDSDEGDDGDDDSEESKAPRKGKSKAAAQTEGETRDQHRVRSLYIAGKVVDAIDLAESLGTKRLASQIRRFHKAETEAKAALASRKGTEAIQKYAEADAIDQEIVREMEREVTSAPGKRVRRSLSSLYQQAGEAYLSKKDTTHAADFLQRSLDYDPGNARSKRLLNSMGGAKSDSSDDDSEGDDDSDDFESE